MSELVDACQEFDQQLARTIDIRIQPALVLQEIEAGSLRSWFISRIEDIDDDDLRNLNWKRIVGKFLVAGKKRTVDAISDTTTIESADQLAEVERGIRQLAIETDLLQIPVYGTVSRPHLVRLYRRFSASLEILAREDSVVLVTEGGRSRVNPHFRLSDEQAEQLVVTESITNRGELILKVKKPDFLGTSMWDLKHDGRTVPTKILDEQWLLEFQSGTVAVQPGDSLRARVETTTHYSAERDVVSVHQTVIEVLEVIRQEQSTQLDFPTEDDRE